MYPTFKTKLVKLTKVFQNSMYIFMQGSQSSPLIIRLASQILPQNLFEKNSALAALQSIGWLNIMQSEDKKWNKACILKLFISVGKKQLRYHKKCFRYYILI